MRRRLAHPPDVIDAGPVILQRNRAADAPRVALAVRESLEHLEPWMPWANPESGRVETQAARIVEVEAGWARGTDFVYVLRPAGGGGDAPDNPVADRPVAGEGPVAGDGPVVGIIGLHRRIGPRAIEIGYWTHVDYSGRGYMSAAAKAVTEAIEALPDVERVEIHTDEANLRSAAIPQKLGYRLDRVATRKPEAPAETGRLQIWVRP